MCPAPPPGSEAVRHWEMWGAPFNKGIFQTSLPKIMLTNDYGEIEACLSTLKQDLDRLHHADLSCFDAIEQAALANLNETWEHLHTLLLHNEAELPQATMLAADSLGLSSADPAADSVSIAHAQAMQYARDLVKAIRQKRESQRRLDMTSEQLIRAEKLATIGQVAATVAHELGNILTPLQMYARLIYDETIDRPQGAETAEFAQQITGIANRASDMLRQLVDAARVEPDMMLHLDLVQVMESVLALLAPQAEGQYIDIQRNYGQSIPAILGRVDQLEQVLLNIGLNAFDAMPDGGLFAVTIEYKADNKQTPEEGHIIIKLRDTGEGISQQNIDQLFEPFFTTKERGAGSGLGLFVSHLIIDQHGGAIEVDSVAGESTTFTIKLPVENKGEHD